LADPGSTAAALSTASMTGFARVDASHGAHSWTWEARSVNGKSLDARCRVPPGYDWLDQAARGAIGQRFKRGNVSVALTLARGEGATRYRLNRPLLDQVIAVARELERAGAEPQRLDAVLGVRGVIEPEERDIEAEKAELAPHLLAGLEELLDRLAEARGEEGARLLAVLYAHLDRLDALTEAARTCAASQPEALRERLHRQVRELLEGSAGLPEERLTQEAALLAGKADVREELDRLAAHLEQARGLIAGGGAVGRKLDFLCQELNREANTLCSKSSDLELTRIGLDLKATIEQFREQVQNIE
jgi:uncharacterized protein (TIGR00255 family)